MDIVFDKIGNTRQIDKRMKVFFSDYYIGGQYFHYYKDNIYHLVIDNKVVGIVQLEFKEHFVGGKSLKSDTTWIYCLEILQPFRNKGYGKILLNEIQKFCLKNGQKRLVLEVNNPIALKLYKNYGFEVIDEYINSDKEKECKMEMLIS